MLDANAWPSEHGKQGLKPYDGLVNGVLLFQTTKQYDVWVHQEGRGKTWGAEAEAINMLNPESSHYKYDKY